MTERLCVARRPESGASEQARQEVVHGAGKPRNDNWAEEAHN